jgi:hypothetical protein
MKIQGHGQPPGVTDADGAKGVSEGISETNATGKTSESGRAFTDKLETTKGASASGAAAPAAPTAGGGIAVADLAAALRAGKVSGRGAVDQLVERIVARQVGPNAPAAVREQVKATLEDALENDPLLAEKLRRL